MGHLFHTWAKKAAFHEPARLVSKVKAVAEERLRGGTKSKKGNASARNAAGGPGAAKDAGGKVQCST